MQFNKSMTVTVVNEQLAVIYPYLQLRFYTKPHDHFQGSRSADEVPADTKLSLLSDRLTHGEIALADTMTVDDLETIMEEKYGLHVQLFRKSGDQWLQTSATDSWTLQEQNDRAAKQAAFSDSQS